MSATDNSEDRLLLPAMWDDNATHRAPHWGLGLGSNSRGSLAGAVYSFICYAGAVVVCVSVAGGCADARLCVPVGASSVVEDGIAMISVHYRESSDGREFTIAANCDREVQYQFVTAMGELRSGMVFVSNSDFMMVAKLFSQIPSAAFCEHWETVQGMTAYVLVGYNNGSSRRLYFSPLRNPEFGEISPLVDELFAKLIELCAGAIDVDFGRLRWRVANASKRLE